ncbi:MAG: VanZ family protein [Ruminococcaceae bacterium]|nr:VanZ family protein [Oscillospiraceae bacterium]
MKFIKYLLWIIVIFIMAIIFVFSSQEGEKSDSISEKISVAISDGKYVPKDKPLVKKEWTDNWSLNAVVRKSAHFSIYLFLGFFMFFALKFSFSKKDYAYVAIAVLVCLIYAVSDEIHQLFTEGRSGNMKDVLIDFSGSSIGIFFALSLKNKFLNKPTLNGGRK